MLVVAFLVHMCSSEHSNRSHVEGHVCRATSSRCCRPRSYVTLLHPPLIEALRGMPWWGTSSVGMPCRQPWSVLYFGFLGVKGHLKCVQGTSYQTRRIVLVYNSVVVSFCLRLLFWFQQNSLQRCVLTKAQSFRANSEGIFGLVIVQCVTMSLYRVRKMGCC